MLEVHLDTVTATSSLNDIPLLTAETCRVSIFHVCVVKNGLKRQLDSEPSSCASEMERLKAVDIRNLTSAALLLPAS